MNRKFFFLSVIIMQFSCIYKGNLPNGILKPAKMQAILWDIILAEAYTGHFITSTGYTKNPSEENVKFQKYLEQK